MAGDRFEFQGPGGRRLEGVVAGADDGPLVVLHHGTPGAGVEVWPPHAERAAARGLRLAEYSRPGAGGSDRVPGRTVADCAADAASLADALGAERFYTIGGSGGGPHALACAALLPGRVAGAATIAGVAPSGAEGLDWLAGMGEENLEEFAAAERGPEALEAFIAEWTPQLREADGEAILAALGDLVSPPDAAALTGDYAEFSAAGMHEALREGFWGWFDDDLALIGDWGFDLAAIEVPVSIWQGRQDRFVPPTHGEWLAEHVASARAHLLDDHGHLSLALAHFDVILAELVDSGAS
jgi:pimeloyl-ACP methyl ester carboxylesterase